MAGTVTEGRIREGVWTVNPQAEMVRLRREGHVLSPALVARCGPWALLIVAGVGCLLAGSDISKVLPVLGVMLIGGGLGRMVHVADQVRLEEIGRAEPLREEFTAARGWLVDLTILQGPVPTGRDQGIMWIENGCLAFSGLRTSFVVPPHGIAKNPARRPGSTESAYGIQLDLDLKTGIGPMALSFWPVEKGAAAYDMAAALEYELNGMIEAARWREERFPGQWPPTALGPGAANSEKLRALNRGELWLTLSGLAIGIPLQISGQYDVAIPILFAALTFFVLRVGPWARRRRMLTALKSSL